MILMITGAGLVVDTSLNMLCEMVHARYDMYML